MLHFLKKKKNREDAFIPSSRDPDSSFLPPGKAFSNSFFILCRLIFPLGHSMRNLKSIEIAVYFFKTFWTMPGSVFPQIEFCLCKTEHQRAWGRIPLEGTLMSPETYFDVTWKKFRRLEMLNSCSDLVHLVVFNVKKQRWLWCQFQIFPSQLQLTQLTG